MSLLVSQHSCSPGSNAYLCFPNPTLCTPGNPGCNNGHYQQKKAKTPKQADPGTENGAECHGEIGFALSRPSCWQRFRPFTGKRLAFPKSVVAIGATVAGCKI
ncbi:unnamed protein product [Pseudo-nitzschia multistriata]|uniref:Uncharacterized protein n=1 Tax=Pseudo-nitzschia multistriata TaxID=183589 RepID=A0A448ZEA2_9STRA|nr:unnamed protein product [Pseudo-nitzschia multistriata]